MLRLKDLLEDGTELNIYGRFPGLEGRKSGGWGEKVRGGFILTHFFYESRHRAVNF